MFLYLILLIIAILLIYKIKIKIHIRVILTIAVIIILGSLAYNKYQKEKREAIEMQQSIINEYELKKQIEEVKDKTEQEESNKRKKEIEKNGLWEYSSETDEITGKTIKLASLKSENWHRFSFPYDQESNWLGLHLRRNPNLDIYLTIEAGQFHNPNKTIQVRFDNTVRTYSYSEESSGRSDIIFIDNPHDFLRRLLKSDTTKIRCTFYDEGSYTYTFVTRKLKF